MPAPHANSEPRDGDERDDTPPATDAPADPDGLIGEDDTDDLALDRMTTEEHEALFLRSSAARPR